jgi:hypothetical protein
MKNYPDAPHFDPAKPTKIKLGTLKTSKARFLEVPSSLTECIQTATQTRQLLPLPKHKLPSLAAKQS